MQNINPKLILNKVLNKNIDDYDRLTNKKYKTTFSEYVRL